MSNEMNNEQALNDSLNKTTKSDKSEKSIKSVTKGTVIRTIILAIALLNQILTATGHSIINVSDETVNNFISAGFTVISAIIAWWKNNSFTSEACLADEILCMEKSKKKARYEICDNETTVRDTVTNDKEGDIK